MPEAMFACVLYVPLCCLVKYVQILTLMSEDRDNIISQNVIHVVNGVYISRTDMGACSVVKSDSPQNHSTFIIQEIRLNNTLQMTMTAQCAY